MDNELQNDVKRNAPSNMEMPTAVTPYDPLPIFKLKMIHFDELFEYLPISDLLRLRQTCKKMNKYTDYFIKTNYPAVNIGCGKISLCSSEAYDRFQQLDATIVKMIKQATINFDFIGEEIADCRGIFRQLERLEIFGQEPYEDLLESVLKLCSNISYLLIEGSNNCLYRQHMPSIESFEIAGYGLIVIDVLKLQKFLEVNKNIQMLSISAGYCSEIQTIF